MRSNIGILIISLASLIFAVIIPVSGLNTTYEVYPDGSGYRAITELTDTDRYEFSQTGMLGEKIPLPVTNISLFQGNENVSFTDNRGVITFQKGNYTLQYSGLISGNQFQAQLDQPRNVSVILPERFKVDNPLLTSIQPSGSVVSAEQSIPNGTRIFWEKVRYIDIRYYDADQEHFLFIFGQFWLIIAILLLVPFFFFNNSDKSLDPDEFRK